ncbi:MAG: hypothetical protein LBI03_02925 [Clostridiales bacterium]|jgi:hypothetical protein|nr:hypothetical protein [Clostridiales bacterium]
MRAINIANDKKRDAEVGIDTILKKSAVHFTLADGKEYKNIKLLKSVLDLSEQALTAKYGSLMAVGEAIIESDPEVDTELIGRYITATHKLYLNREDKIAYRVNLTEVIKNPDGTEKDRRDLTKAESNVDSEIPVQWTGKKFPKSEAVKKFVFSRKYQIKHVSGLTYDFLYQMAKDLADSDSLMFVGAGKKGNEPLVLTTGGEPYRAFLEGRIDGDKYCLILHLTNMELKGV